MPSAQNKSPVVTSEFSIERVFDAPRDLVWQAHSQVEHLAQWWGPKGCKLEVKSLEFRPGGLFHYAMRYSTGAEMWGRFFYREIDQLERIVWLNSFANEGGGITRAPFSADCPLEMLNTMTLTSEGRHDAPRAQFPPLWRNASRSTILHRSQA